MTLADRIVAMHGGVVQQVGAPLELYDRPANLFIAGFIGSPGMNFLEGQYVSTGEKAAIRFKDGTEIAVEERACFPQDQKVTLGIRPEHVVISPDGAIEAGVELVEPTGFGIIMHLSIHGLSFKLFTLHRSVLGATAKVRVDFPSDHLHVFDHGGKRIKERSSTD